MKSPDKAKVRASLDKTTKNTYRFIIKDNEYGISGVIYVNKDSDIKEYINNSLKVIIKPGEPE